MKVHYMVMATTLESYSTGGYKPMLQLNLNFFGDRSGGGEFSKTRDSMQYKKKISVKKSGGKPFVGESGSAFAKRLLYAKYGPGNYKKGSRTAYNQLKKYGATHFR